MRFLLPILLLAAALPARANEPLSFEESAANTAQLIRVERENTREASILRLADMWRAILSVSPFNAREWEGGVDTLTYRIKRTAACRFEVETLVTSEGEGALIAKTDTRVDFSNAELAELMRLASADKRAIGVSLNLKKKTPLRKYYSDGNMVTAYTDSIEWIGSRRGEPESAKLQELVVVLNGLKRACAGPS